jgi:beta propeller repeat protein
MTAKTILMLVAVILIVMFPSQEAKADFPICTATRYQYHPAINGNIVVWQDFRNENWDIYGYNLETDAEFPICTDTNSTNFQGEENPAIDGNKWAVCGCHRRQYRSLV